MTIDYEKLVLSLDNMDTYFSLTQKVDCIKKVAPSHFKGKLLDLGCGRMPYKSLIKKFSSITEYIGMDISHEYYEQNIYKPDMIWDGTVIPLIEDSIDTVILVEVLEHVPNAVAILKEVKRVLKDNGEVFITVPFLWNLHDVPYDEYRYTPFSLKRIFMEAGFSHIEINTFGNWHASLALFLGSWVRRSRLSDFKRKLFSMLALPLVKYLYKRDRFTYGDSVNNFKEGAMCTGFWVIAKK